MALFSNTFEAGVASGTAISSTAPGAPDAFDLFSGAACDYQGSSYQGTLGGRSFAQGGYFGWTNKAGASNAGTAFRIYVWTGAAPTTNSQSLFQFRSSTGGTGLFSLLHQTNGLLQWNSDATATVNTTGTLPLSQWVRIEVGFTNTANPGAVVTLRCYLGDSTTPITGLSLDITGGAMFTSACGHVRIGRAVNLAGTYQVYYDLAAFQTGSATLIGPYVAPNAAPTADAGLDQTVEPWATVALSGTDSDSDGSVVTRTWARTSGLATGALSGSGADRTFVAPATVDGGSITFTYTVTDNGGLTASDTAVVTVLPVTERAVIGGVEVPMQIREN